MNFVTRATYSFLICLSVLTLVSRIALSGEPLPTRPVKDEIATILKSDPGDGDFRFVVMGDTRDGDSMFSYLIDLASDLNPAFIIDVGDLVHSGAEYQFRNYVDLISKSRVPFISVIGNHEDIQSGGIEIFKEIFGETDFYFDYGGVRFIAIDNSVVYKYGLSDSQMLWLEDKLRTDLIKMVFMHAPPKTRLWTASMHPDKNSSEFMELVERYNVRKVYFGHVHAYDHLRRGNTEYVMTGCGGAEPDPVSEFYDPISGGYYHFLIVEVRDGKVMDVLVAPTTSDLTDFQLANGVNLEFPYAAYRHFNTPIVDYVKPDSGGAFKDKTSPVTVRAYSNPDAVEVGLQSLSMFCIDSDGKRYSDVKLKSDFIDERVWTGVLPPMSASGAECFVSARDGVKSGYANVPSVDQLAGGSFTGGSSSIPFTSLGRDRNDSSTKLIDELDILETSFAYNDDYYFLKMEVEGGFKGGSKTSPRVLNIYGFSLIDDSLVIEADVKKMLGAVPLIVYGPYMTSMGFPKCGIYDMTNYASGKLDFSKKGVKCKVDGNQLFLRVDRSIYPRDVTGVKILAATARFIVEPKMDFMIGDAADIVDVKLGGFKIPVR